MGRIILAIDNDPSTLDFIASVVEPRGYTLLRAQDGEEGLRRFHDDLPDLVILELMLPRRDGSSVCEEIKASEHGLITPLVIISAGLRNQSPLKTIREHEAFDFLSKPTTSVKLEGLLDKVFPAFSETDELVPEPRLDKLWSQPAETLAIERGVALDLLLRCHFERRTGAVVAVCGNQKRALEFDDGHLIGALSNLPSERLEQIVLTSRRMDRGQVTQVKSRCDRESESFVEAALALGSLTADSAPRVLAEQASLVLSSLFEWRTGGLKMLEHESIAGRPAGVRSNTLSLVLAGMRRYDWHARLGIAAMNHATRFVATARLLSLSDRASLSRRERSLLDLIDTPHDLATLRQIGEFAQQPIDEPLAVLLGAGLLDAVLDAAKREPPLPATSTEAIPTRGVLGAKPLVELLGALARTRATGMLLIQGEVRRGFGFTDGKLCFARSSSLCDRLGQVLLTSELITAQQLEKALQLQKKERSGQLLGSILVEQGVLTLGQLLRATRRAVMLIVDSTFRWTEGEYNFIDSDGEVTELDLALTTHDLLRRGAALLPTEFLERRWCEGSDRFLLQAVAASPPADLDDEERALLRAAVDGQPLRELPGLETGRAATLAHIEFLLAAGLIALERVEPEVTSLDSAWNETQTIIFDETSMFPLDVAPEEEPSAKTQPLPAVDEPTAAAAADSREAESPTPAETVLFDVDARAITGHASSEELTLFFDRLRDELSRDERENAAQLLRLLEDLGGLRERVQRLDSEHTELLAQQSP